MRCAFLLGALLVLAACGPVDPTGNAVTAPSTLDGESVVSVERIGVVRDVPQVRVRVFGDLVYGFVVIDGELFRLAGEPLGDGWLQGRGTLVTTLPPGEHTLKAYSCEETAWGWNCGCRAAGDCGYWMQSSFSVAPSGDARRLGEDETFLP